MKSTHPDKALVAACGLFCKACAVYIASQKDPERLKMQAEALNLTVEECYCEGCRSENRNGTCESCFMLQCTTEKGIDFCSECSDYPCNKLKEFQAVKPHRLELWKDLDRIKEAGFETYFAEALENYKCPKCDTINSAFDMACRKCHFTPSCLYVENNREGIINRMK